MQVFRLHPLLPPSPIMVQPCWIYRLEHIRQESESQNKPPVNRDSDKDSNAVKSLDTLVDPKIDTSKPQRGRNESISESRFDRFRVKEPTLDHHFRPTEHRPWDCAMQKLDYADDEFVCLNCWCYYHRTGKRNDRKWERMYWSDGERLDVTEGMMTQNH